MKFIAIHFHITRFLYDFLRKPILSVILHIKILRLLRSGYFKRYFISEILCPDNILSVINESFIQKETCDFMKKCKQITCANKPKIVSIFGKVNFSR